MPSSTMASSVDYKCNLFKQVNLTHIHGEPTFETINKLQNEIKRNSESVDSNLGGGAHGNLVLVLTDVQYALIFPTFFVYPTHPGPLIIQEVITAHTNSNM